MHNHNFLYPFNPVYSNLSRTQSILLVYVYKNSVDFK